MRVDVNVHESHQCKTCGAVITIPHAIPAPDERQGLLREALDTAEREVIGLVHPFDHPAAHRVFQDLRAALALAQVPAGFHCASCDGHSCPDV